MRDDPYEHQFMSSGRVGYRDKASQPRWLKGILGISFILALIAIIANGILTGVWLLPLLVFAFVLFLFLMMNTLRVSVDDENIHIQYGIFGPTIPLESIELCQAEQYEILKYGGYGVRYSLFDRSWIYNVVGDKGRAVRIHYRNKRGKLKKVLIGTATHQLLANAINESRAKKGLENESSFALDFENKDEAQALVKVEESENSEKI